MSRSVVAPPLPGLNLLTLPFEVRYQIYTHAFSNLHLAPLPPPSSLSRSCRRCQLAQHASPPPQYFSQFFIPLLTSRQLYTEASPLLFSTLTLCIVDTFTLERIRKPRTSRLRDRIIDLDLTIHLDPKTRLAWHTALSQLVPKTFPNLKFITIHNHLRAPINHDRLVDALYLVAPLVTPSSLPARLRSSPGLTLDFSYQRDEPMFESSFLGEITTEDSLDAHKAMVRDLMRDPGFLVAAEVGDFEDMTERLSTVARGHKRRWLKGLQRRRLNGLTFKQFAEGVRVGEGGPQGAGGGVVRRRGTEEIMAELGMTREEVERHLKQAEQDSDSD